MVWCSHPARRAWWAWTRLPAHRCGMTAATAPYTARPSYPATPSIAPILWAMSSRGNCRKLQPRRRKLEWLRAANEPHPPRSAFQQLTGDHQPLDFAGAFAYGAELDVAVELLHRIVFDEAVAAVDLNGVVADANRDFRGE